MGQDTIGAEYAAAIGYGAGGEHAWGDRSLPTLIRGLLDPELCHRIEDPTPFAVLGHAARGYPTIEPGRGTPVIDRLNRRLLAAAYRLATIGEEEMRGWWPLLESTAHEDHEYIVPITPDDLRYVVSISHGWDIDRLASNVLYVLQTGDTNGTCHIARLFAWTEPTPERAAMWLEATAEALSQEIASHRQRADDPRPASSR